MLKDTNEFQVLFLMYYALVMKKRIVGCLLYSPCIPMHKTLAIFSDAESNQMARGASQPRPAQEHPPLGPASMETVGKATGDGGVQSPRSGDGRRKMKKKTTPAGI